MPDTPVGIETLYAVSSGRTTYRQRDLDMYERHGETGNPALVDKTSHANLVSSEVGPDRHMPVIDCDYPIQAVPSSTQGHYHLYIDQELTWEQYKCLLDGLYGAGLIQKGWYNAALKDKRTYVRLPHVKKMTDAEYRQALNSPF